MTMIKNTTPAVVTTTLVDDLDGETTGKTVQTREFVIDGEKRQIDLSAKNYKLFKDAVAPFVKVSRVKAPASKGNPEAKAARAWALANGHEVPARGRLSADVLAAYAARDTSGETAPAEIPAADSE